jgi:hypothetical protein
VFELLLKASACPDSSHAQILQALSDIRGPYALVYYDGPRRRLYYGRDCLGRRSLLFRTEADHSFTLSSVSHDVSETGWAEIEANGIHVLCLQDSNDKLLNPTLFPLSYAQDNEQIPLSLVGFPSRKLC